MSSPFSVRRVFPVALPLVAVASGLAWGGQAWLLVVPAMFVLGRSYGSPTHVDHPLREATYGVGAALAGFTPEERG